MAHENIVNEFTEIGLMKWINSYDIDFTCNEFPSFWNGITDYQKNKKSGLSRNLLFTKSDGSLYAESERKS